MDLIFPNTIGKLMDGICSGWALSYAIVVAVLTALVAFGWFLLTDKPIHTLGQGIGVVMVVRHLVQHIKLYCASLVEGASIDTN